MRVGDIILGMDGETVGNPGDLVALLYTKSPGDHISLSVLREKRKINTDAILQSIDEGSTVVEIAPAQAVEPKTESEKTRLMTSMTYQDMTPEMRAHLDPSAPQGPVILRVQQGGAAEAAGLRSGDIVLLAGDTKTPDAQTLDKVLRKADLNKGLRLFIWRGGATMYSLIQTNKK
jgi:serine protease Do